MDRPDAPGSALTPKARGTGPAARSPRAPLAPKRPRATVDRALEVGAKAHYDDPAYYAKTYAEREDDVAFYRALAKKEGGSILEYGIGNGRLALPMAREGATVSGIDWSLPMLADLTKRLAPLPAEVRARVKATHGDMRETRLGKRFPLVLCTFNTMLHLYTRDDVERFLAGVRSHLAKGGRFVFDVSIPQPGDLDRDPSRAYGAPRFRDPATDKIVRYTERFDYDAARQILFVTQEMTPIDGSDGWVVPLSHRQFFPQELEALLHYNGFEVRDVRGGFEGEPLTRHSDVGVWTAVAR